ncbi:Cytochrome b2 [Diaporthe amygdali]|uniref:Cytochrome b2 n=1 Tax=Phomopsis amygdali TaxID=1214568 RepID=UPI0022FE7A44|nr:Cytochrome b2 [Diaporthe amygdali]KAJ0120017.1 Cytochrome b2 [Diaporthe amygdali]
MSSLKTLLANFVETCFDSVAGSMDTNEQKLIPFGEVQKHQTANDCWIVIKGEVFDVTSFIQTHPGGAQAILAHAGSDATELFTMMHARSALDSLRASMLLGPIDPATLPANGQKEATEDERRQSAAREEMPSAQNFFLLQDFEQWGERVLSNMAWAYYRSASDEERSFDENRDAFRRYFFRPRILRDTSSGTIETTIVNLPTSMPLFISPCAMAKLGHPLGEINLTRSAGKYGIIQMLYLNKERTASSALIRKVEQLGARAIVFTVDVCWQSKRTLDVRTKGIPSHSSAIATSTSKGVSEAIGEYQDRNLTWKDIGFIQSHTKLPIIVKGVQSLEDVELCVANGVQGVVLSNHGGRQADYAPAPIDILYEIRTYRPDLFSKLDIMIDGGVRCGADVVKALALGAKAVGIGRPFLYANGTHGEAGCDRVAESVTKIEELKPEMPRFVALWYKHLNELNLPSRAIPPFKRISFRFLASVQHCSFAAEPSTLFLTMSYHEQQPYVKALDLPPNTSCLLVKKRAVRIEPIAWPVLQSDGVLVKVISNGICGSDMHAYLAGGVGGRPILEPTVMGHEAAGEVVAVGENVTSHKPGDRVADFSLFRPIWRLIYLHLLIGMKLVAYSHLLGCGPIGLITAAVAHAYSARKIIAFDISQRRVDFAKKYMSPLTGKAIFDHVFHIDSLPSLTKMVQTNGSHGQANGELPASEDTVAVDTNHVETEGDAKWKIASQRMMSIIEQCGLSAECGVDRVIEASGAEDAMLHGVAICKQGGIYLQVGLGHVQTHIFPTIAVTNKELDVRARGVVDLRPLITAKYPLSRAQEAFEAVASGMEMKVIIKNQEM